MKNKNIIAFLESRITQTEKEISDRLDLVMTKGAKITAYKEIMHYIKSHPKSTKLTLTKSD